MNQEVMVSLLRTILQIVGTAIAAHGYISDANWALISGAVLTVATTLYTVWTRWNTAKVPASAAIPVALNANGLKSVSKTPVQK